MRGSPVLGPGDSDSTQDRQRPGNYSVGWSGRGRRLCRMPGEHRKDLIQVGGRN